MRKLTIRLSKEESSIPMPNVAVVGTYYGKEVTCYCMNLEDAHVFARSVNDFKIFDIKSHRRLL
jgi:hypothetical protein